MYNEQNKNPTVGKTYILLLARTPTNRQLERYLPWLNPYLLTEYAECPPPPLFVHLESSIYPHLSIP